MFVYMESLVFCMAWTSRYEYDAW